MAFHVKHGWYFERTEDGGVRIKAPDSMGPGANQVVELDEDTWASVVASVSAKGEDATNFGFALGLHQGMSLQELNEALYFTAAAMAPRRDEDAG